MTFREFFCWIVNSDPMDARCAQQVLNHILDILRDCNRIKLPEASKLSREEKGQSAYNNGEVRNS